MTDVDPRDPERPTPSDSSESLDAPTEAFVSPAPATARARRVEAGPLREKIGRYPIRNELGRGGMGVVYLAEDPTLGRDVALKVLPDSVAHDPARLERFRQEARLLAAINHPNIATIHTLEEADGVSFLTMEAIEGETLRRRLSGDPLTLRDALRIGRRVARALETAHKQGVVHRDLKPGNVMVSPDLGVKVLDFGLAAPASEDQATLAPAPGSATDEVSGTPGYMSPEQAAGASADPRSDIWSFGCLMFECLSGVRAFQGQTPSDLIHSTLTTDPDLDHLRDTTPSPLRDMVARCLARDTDERYPLLTEPRRVIEELLAEMSLFQARDDEGAAEGSTPHNLPRHASSFVGRAEEVRAVAALAAEHRLVTLTGMGGVGKTRLVLRVAETSLDGDHEGIWFVDLAPLSNPDEIAGSIVEALRIPESLDRSMIDVIVDYLGDRRILLILDNCEHLLDGVATVVNGLLARAPGVRLLLTSRERLGIDGETCYPVPLLGLPDETGSSDPSTIGQAAAVELFVQRARQAGVSIEVDESNATTIAEICRRLDGIPLAVELAASRLRALSLDDLLRRLDDRFRILTGGSRVGLPHHRTLRALIDWSYDQLALEERALLNRLSVFAGGWTLEAAEEVATGGVVNDWDVLDLMARLVDKSLIEADVGATGGVARFRILETVREYGAERLREAGESEEMWRRHRDAFIAFATRAEPECIGVRQAFWFSRVEDDYENLRRAFDSCADAEADPSLGLRLAAALFRFWMVRGHWHDASAISRQVIDRGAHLPPGEDMAKVLNALAATSFYHGRLDEAKAHWERALEVWTRIGSQRGIAATGVNLGNVAYGSGDYETGRRRFTDSLATYRKLDDADGICRALISLANVAVVRGDYEESRGHAAEAVELLRGMSHAELTAHALITLGTAELRLELLDDARVHYEESLEIQEELGDKRNRAIATVNLAVVSQRQGRMAEAEAGFKESATRFLELGEGANVASALDGLGALAAETGRPEHTARVYGAANAIREQIGMPRMPEEEQVVSTITSQITEALGEDRVASLLAEGAAMGMDAAVAWAVETIRV